MSSRFDVAVVGGGPAGAFAAYLLARAGAHVAIFDASHPREKPCGGGVTARALALAAGAIDATRLRAVPIERAAFRDASGRVVDVPLDHRGTHPPLLVASRTEFDAALLSAAVGAGATLVPARVVDVARERKSMLVSTGRGAFTADWLVGADGANSLVRRRWARPFTRAQLSIATGFFARGVTSSAIVLELVADPPGYIWSFPRPDHLAIGMCAQADAGASSARLRDVTADWIAATRIAPGATLAPYAWPIPSLSVDDIDALEVSGPGWCLIGDAAGLVDPMTREGIYFALESARLAAAALTARHQPERLYADALHAGCLDELARAARLKAGFFRPRFAGLLLDALDRSAAVRHIMADLISGVQGYRGLKWRLARTLELELAWRALGR